MHNLLSVRMLYSKMPWNFSKLGLVIIDEQHRFGVDQRLALRNKGANQFTPHQLVMTATLIPAHRDECFMVI